MKIILIKQIKYLKRQKSILSVSILYFLITSFSSFQNVFINNEVQYFTYSLIVTCLIFSTFQVSFWTEKVTGVLEQILVSGISIKKYVLLTASSITALNLFLAVGLYAVIILVNYVALEEFIFSIYDLLIIVAIVVVNTLTFIIVNGYTMTSTSQSIAKMFQIIIIVFIISSLLTFSTNTNLSFSDIVLKNNQLVFVFFSLILIAIVSFFKISDEKTILTAGE